MKRVVPTFESKSSHFDNLVAALNPKSMTLKSVNTDVDARSSAVGSG